jgi:hypothetical protein
MQTTDLPCCLPVRGLLPARIALSLAFAMSWVFAVGCNCGITDDVVVPNDDDDTVVVLPDDDDDQTHTFENEDCSNGIDDDQDGLTDCGDSDCAGDAACAHECVGAVSISCGETVTGNNGGPAHTNAIDTYPTCTTWDESGPEYAISFTAAADEEVNVLLSVAGHENLDIFVLKDENGECEGTDCIAFGANGLHFTSEQGEEYLILVDGYAGGQDNFSVTVECESTGGPSGTEICFNDTDDDSDGLVDCDDPDCALDPVCIDEECGNGIDDDGDGYADCDDTECWSDPGCNPEDCDNGSDDNGNALVDCDDPMCWTDPVCNSEDCHDGIDNDGDLFEDCDDSDCFGTPDCIDEICGNSLDDDGDGLIDCDDAECYPEPGCVQEICNNNFDDDGDGAMDCADPECFTHSACVAEICDNGSDDDSDGDVDCDDSECNSDPACNAVCEPVALALTCGNLFSANTNSPDSTDVIGQYGCTPSNESGNEMAYSFVSAINGEVTVVADGLTSDLDLFVLQDQGGGCDPNTCVDFSTNGGMNAESVTFPVVSGNTYYVVVDGWNNNVGPFELNVACDDTVTPSEICNDGIDNDGDTRIDCLDVDCVGAPGCSSEDCDDNIDNDLDAFIDCADADCDTSPDCISEICTNSIDDDGDGLIDCNDPECSILPTCSSENCYDNIDNDGDALIDCDDSDCIGNPLCNPSPPGTENCTNGIDDDGDSLVDCADTAACATHPACTGSPWEDCGNGVDDDGDGLADCDDPECNFDVMCSGAPAPEICDDAIDNDGDGFIDCDDSNCSALPACGGSGTEICGNNVDDDGDGDVDCDDIACLFDIFCWIFSEDCDDGIDNDFDSGVDCADLDDCVDDPVCIPEICTDGVDNDGDGQTDCGDDECDTDPWCAEELCDNGLDDDGDGDVDCADWECIIAPQCQAENCSNGVDDDADGAVDCADSECNGNPICASATESNCHDGIDNNGDGRVDCADPTCASNSDCIPENCSNGTDDDGDLAADCDDAECVSTIDCQAELCWNGADDDGDGDADCDDEDCLSWPSCDSEICDDGVDNDGDLDVDCDDTGCIDRPICNEEICNAPADEDGDGLVNCADPDCNGDPACTSSGETCNNGIDDDGDGDVDCGDSDCDGMPACSEDCSNDVDDDGDGDIDCEDSDCPATVPGCGSEICNNDIDDDGDGRIDCGDTDCADIDPICIPEICGNGTDDDGDGLTDCDDEECDGEDPACGEVCDDFVDNDGDGDIDCDDSDCDGDDSCPADGVGGVCIDQWELSCGDTDSWSNWQSGSANVIDQYSCVSWEMTGREYTYVFRPALSEEVTVSLSGMSQDLDIFVIEEAGGCDGSNCLDFGNNFTSFDAVAGEEYYFVVDGYQGATTGFTIDIECPSTNEICDNGIDDDGDGLTDCQDEYCETQAECREVCTEVWSVFCGTTTSYSTNYFDATDVVNSYSCTSWEETGPEVGYYFQAPLDQANEVTVTLDYDQLAFDLDVFILQDEGIPCDSEACLDYGGISTTFETTPGADYWVVVDGYQGDSGAYSINVQCEGISDAEDCDNGLDDDGDADVDCDDSDCQSSPLCASTCESVGTISCGDYVMGDTSLLDNGSTDQVGGYPCKVGNYTGREMAYEFLASGTGTVTWDLENQTPTVVDHDLFVLDGDNGACLNVQCLEEGGYGGNSVEFEAVAGHTYYLVIDGFNGAEGPFEAQVLCDF